MRGLHQADFHHYKGTMDAYKFHITKYTEQFYSDAKFILTSYYKQNKIDQVELPF